MHAAHRVKPGLTLNLNICLVKMEKPVVGAPSATGRENEMEPHITIYNPKRFRDDAEQCNYVCLGILDNDKISVIDAYLENFNTVLIKAMSFMDTIENKDTEIHLYINFDLLNHWDRQTIEYYLDYFRNKKDGTEPENNG